MEYISAKEFLKQSLEVQNVFVDWWRPSIGDLFSWIKKDDGYEHDLRKFECCNSDNIVEMTNLFKGIDDGDRIPLLSEGQLRKFIEDKTSRKMDATLVNEFYCLVLIDNQNKDYYSLPFITEETDLLQAYWKVACEIASKEVVEHGQTK